jgi:PAS domain S-box-containing protein
LNDDTQPSHGLYGDPAAAASAQGLADRGQLALIAVERTRMPMVITDPRQPDNPIVLANHSFLKLSGYSASEVIGRNCRFLQGPDTDPIAVAEIRAAVLTQRNVTVELLNYKKEGEPFWAQLYLSPIHDDEGNLIYFFGSQLDVTARRRVEAMEATEHRLLKEVDHRAMNVLAIVEGIVRLTRAETMPLYTAAVQSRVQSLSRAHAILARRGWKNVPLADLITSQIEPFGARRVALDGPEVLLGGHLVQPLALVVHELIANSTTHGALTQPTGSLTVRWFKDSQRRSLELEWNERGGPSPPTIRPPGFGTTIMKGIVNRQLGGRLRRTWDAEGLKAHLSIPVDA